MTVRQEGLLYCNKCGCFHPLLISDDGKQFIFLSPEWVPFETTYSAQ
jgi:hypothetical protein